MSRVFWTNVTEVLFRIFSVPAYRQLKPARVVARSFTAAVALLFLLQSSSVHAFSFLPAPYETQPGVVIHPFDYGGLGGQIDITVGIDPTSIYAPQMLTGVINSINTWNQLQPTLDNVKLASQSPIPADTLDFESVVLHEIGHALGLSHPNIAPESGIENTGLNYTTSRTGPNGNFDFNPGPDQIIGSADDLRGDDVNYNFFAIDSNNPFYLPPVIDKTTFTTDLSKLPAGDSFATNADRDVAALYGLTNSSTIANEAVMQQGVVQGEIQRQLSFDDVAGIMYAASGLDETAGTADDYTINITFAGFTTNADITICFADEFDIAGLMFSTYRINETHREMQTAKIMFNDVVNWYFDENNICISGDVNCDGTVDLLDLTAISEHYQQSQKCRMEGDLDGNSTVDLIDLVILGDNYGKSVITPEPASCFLLLAASFIMYRRK